MENFKPLHLSEILFASSDSKQSKMVSSMKQKGLIKKIAPRVYTSNFEDPPQAIIRRNLFSILGKLYPQAILSHRSAFEFKPTTSGDIFLTYTYTKNISLPGVTIRFLKGQGPIEGDQPFVADLFVSQQERAFLENLQITKNIESKSKVLSRSDIEEKLDQMIRIHGENHLHQFREKVKKIARKLSMHQEYKKLNHLIGALLSSKPSSILISPLTMARAFGRPYDPNRIQLFETLCQFLKQIEFIKVPDPNVSNVQFRNFAFYESYFSNYIEGTTFELNEAKKIIETKTPLPHRVDDSHDILGTFEIVNNVLEMNKIPSTAEEMMELLQSRHQILLKYRTSNNPGKFKEQNNRAGNTFFVDYNLVRGTLSKGFDYYKILDHPFAKAAYIHFLISEVHPFMDGNGRIARIMMNAELVKENRSKIIIPTVYRDDYLGALRLLTRKNKPKVYIQMLQRALKFSVTICDNDMVEIENHLNQCHAFQEPSESLLKIV
ncbi:MAG: Fic family protein [Flavobacteriaceae bacterium]|nr:Fic family protein [Flavobacteriaceae bacterium]